MRRLAIAVFGALAFSAAPAHAATFQVNTTDDNTVCNAVACSLRGAFLTAQNNGLPEVDVINVPAGVYSVPELSTSLGVVPVTIVGAGANATFIQPTGTNRLFNLLQGTELTITDATIRGGRPATGVGGNIAVSSIASLTLARVRISDGRAPGGGGISASGSTAITISRSLIDGNVATGVGRGGGIWMPGQTTATQLTITDSTITGNNAANGGAISTTGNLPAPPENRHTSLRGVTIAFNTARDGGQGGVGGIQVDSSAVRFQGSVIAGNTSTVNLGAGSVQVPTNCAIGGAVTDEGGNVEDQNQCGLSAASLRTTNPQLATTLDASQPPVLAIPATSPAVNFADCGGRTLDQRGVPRPQGALCDAGAYEFNPAPDTSIAGAGPPFAFSATDPGSTFECSLDGAPFTPCTSPFDPVSTPGTHTLAVRAVDPQGQADATPATVTYVVPGAATPTPTPTPTPTATPVVNRTIVVGPARGTVRVKVPGSNRYVDLDSTIGIPVGSSLDTRKGRVTLTSIPKAGAAPQTAVFFDGLFKVTQSRGITNLTLTEQLAACPKKKSGRASAAAKKAKKRKLWGDGKGAFRTSGRYSAATVRGTKWLVEDTCAGTRTTVRQGSVTVRHRNRTIIVRAGKNYLAKPR